MGTRGTWSRVSFPHLYTLKLTSFARVHICSLAWISNSLTSLWLEIVHYKAAAEPMLSSTPRLETCSRASWPARAQHPGNISRYSDIYIHWFKVNAQLSDLVSSWVNVLSKEIEEQPITNITSSNNCVNTFSFDPPTTEQQQMCEISEFRGWGLKNTVSSGRKGST